MVAGRIAAAFHQSGVPQETKPAKPARVDGTVLRLSTDELVRLAPRLRGYLATPAPSWPDVVDAADWLRGELGVSKPLWGEACLAMGREEAAIAVAIVSAKPADHFRSSPGGYFHGMVAKAKAGELNLARTIWGLRARDRKAGEGRSPRRANCFMARATMARRTYLSGAEQGDLLTATDTSAEGEPPRQRPAETSVLRVKPIAPLLRWPGGKSGELNRIRAHMPHTVRNYFEPFIGGGAVFLALNDRVPAYLNDISKELVDFYAEVAIGAADICRILQKPMPCGKT